MSPHDKDDQSGATELVYLAASALAKSLDKPTDRTIVSALVANLLNRDVPLYRIGRYLETLSWDLEHQKHRQQRGQRTKRMTQDLPHHVVHPPEEPPVNDP
jgi:hypothetical protein